MTLSIWKEAYHGQVERQAETEQQEEASENYQREACRKEGQESSEELN